MNKKTEQYRLPVDLVRDLEAYSEASGMSKTEIVINALRDNMASGIRSRLSKRIKGVEQIIYDSTKSTTASKLVKKGKKGDAK